MVSVIWAKNLELAEFVKELEKRDIFSKVVLEIIEESEKKRKYRISEWAEFQVWKFLQLQKLANFKVKFPYLKPTAHSEIEFL